MRAHLELKPFASALVMNEFIKGLWTKIHILLFAVIVFVLLSADDGGAEMQILYKTIAHSRIHKRTFTAASVLDFYGQTRTAICIHENGSDFLATKPFNEVIMMCAF